MVKKAPYHSSGIWNKSKKIKKDVIKTSVHLLQIPDQINCWPDKLLWRHPASQHPHAIWAVDSFCQTSGWRSWPLTKVSPRTTEANGIILLDAFAGSLAFDTQALEWLWLPSQHVHRLCSTISFILGLWKWILAFWGDPGSPYSGEDFNKQTHIGKTRGFRNSFWFELLR